MLGHCRDEVVAPVIGFLGAELPFAQAMEGLIIRGHTRLESMERERRDAFERWYARALEHGEANPTLSPSEAAQYIDAQSSMMLLHMGMGHCPRPASASSTPVSVG